MDRPRLLNWFINLGHTVDHLLMLIYPDRGAGDGAGLRLELRRHAETVARRLYRLWRLFAAGRLARRPLEPARHDDRVLPRHRRRRRSSPGCTQAPWQLAAALTLVGAVRRDLPPGRHRHAGQGRGAGRPGARHQRHLGQSRGCLRGVERRRPGATDRVARGFHPAGSRRRLRWASRLRCWSAEVSVSRVSVADARRCWIGGRSCGCLSSCWSRPSAAA